MARIDRIVVDRAPWATRVAFLASDEVIELWVEGADRPSLIGAVALARVTAVHRELGAATVAIPGGEASLSDRSARAHAPGVEPEVDDGGRLFEDCGAADALESALARRVALADGGELVIESMEAATLIDVNLAAGARDGFRRANEAAALAAVRQIRLRGLRGVVLLDLPRMTDRGARARVVQLVTEMTADDPAPLQVLGWTPGGMLEMARKGVRRPLADDLLEVSAELPASARAAAWAALAGLRREAGRIARPRLVVAPAVARWLDGPGRPILDAERARLGHLEIAADPALGRDVFRVEIED